MSADVTKDIDQIRKDLSKLGGDVSSLTETLKTLIGEEGRRAKAKASAATDEALAGAGRLAAEAEDAVRERPLAYAAIVFGAGYLIGRLLARR